MTAPIGRREAGKQATRAALMAAATRLFAERGFEATTVADIAQAAAVTQRTFYRYFDGKEDLVAEEYRTWLAGLREAILARPAAEPPLAAVREAMISAGAPAPIWLFSGRPFRGLRRLAARPLVRFEAAVAGAILARAGAGREGGERAGGERGEAAPDRRAEFEAQVIARVAVAAFRSAVISRRESQDRGGEAVPGLDELLADAFAVIRDL